MTEKEYDEALKELQVRERALRDERTRLCNDSFNVMQYCPRLDRLGEPPDHSWLTVSVDSVVLPEPTGQLVVAKFECRCGARMEIAKPDAT